jgi:hypothetical protein
METREVDMFSFVSKVLTISAGIILAPIAAVACIPLACFLAPVAIIALPFMVTAFFGESKEVGPASKPLRQLQTQYTH